MCKGIDTLTGFCYKKGFMCHCLTKAGWPCVHPAALLLLAGKLTISLAHLETMKYIYALNKPHSLANFCAHELMFANTLHCYLIS